MASVEDRRGEEPHSSPFYPASGRAFWLAFGLAPIVALALAVTIPVTCAVAAVVVAGVAHVGLETRYLAGRYGLSFDGRTLGLLFVPLTVIALVRLAGVGAAGTRVEVAVAAVVVLAAMVWVVGARAPRWKLVVPVAFLWEWSKQTGTAVGRRLFRTAQAAWALVVPALILAGAFDSLLNGWGVLSWSGDRSASAVAAVYTPAGWAGPWPARFVALFAFGQLMHYVVWCAYVPAVAGREHRRAALTPGVGPVFDRGRFVRILAVVAVAVGVLHRLAGAIGRRAYSALASYHVYLELPLLGLLSAGALGTRAVKDHCLADAALAAHLDAAG